MTNKSWYIGTLIWAILMLSACSSPQYRLVKKADMEAADQCLLAQQAGQVSVREQQEQIARTLDILKQTLELRQRGNDTVREFVREARPDFSDEGACEPAESASLATMPLEKSVVGGKEKILFTDLGIVLQSRVDTGATTASLDARDIELFERDGEEWVRFKVYDPGMDEMVDLERKRVRRVLITQSSTEEPERRPVVEMRVTLGNLTQVAEFTLVDRSHMEHPVLVGRNILRDVLLVDVGKSNVSEPSPPRSANQP